MSSKCTIIKSKKTAIILKLFYCSPIVVPNKGIVNNNNNSNMFPWNVYPLN